MGNMDVDIDAIVEEVWRDREIAAVPKPPLWRRVVEGTREFIGGVGYMVVFFVGLPLVLAAFWIVVSYVVMLVGWIAGVGHLHPFPHMLLLPDGGSGPGSNPPPPSSGP